MVPTEGPRLQTGDSLRELAVCSTGDHKSHRSHHLLSEMIRFLRLGEDGEQRYRYEADRSAKFRHVLRSDWLKVDGKEPDGFLRII